MGKFELDLSGVAKVVAPDPNRLPLEGNKDRLVRVAFDLFRLKGDSAEDLWQIQADDDGNEFLVRTYNLPEEEQRTAMASDWSVVSDAKGSNLTVLYRNVPIHRLAAATAGASTPADVELLRQTVQEKLSADDAFVSKFINSIPEEKCDLLSTAGFFDIFKRRSHPAVRSLMKMYREIYPGDSEKSLERTEKRFNDLFWNNREEYSKRAQNIREIWEAREEQRQRDEQRDRAVERSGLESKKLQDKIKFDVEREMEQERYERSLRPKKDLADMLTDPDTVMEKVIPESEKEIEEDIWVMRPEDREDLERALSKLDPPDVMTSAR